MSHDSSDESGRQMRKLDTSGLTQKSVKNWSVQDVAAFLQHHNFGGAASRFVEEMVSGEELVDLEDGDLKELGVRKLGERKRLLKKVKALVKSGSVGALETTGSTSRGARSATSSDDDVDAVEFNAKYKKKSAKIVATTDILLDELLDRLADEFGVRVRINGRDEDGDLYKIKSDKTLYEAMDGEARVDLVCVKVTGAAGKKHKGGSGGKAGAASASGKKAVGKKALLSAAATQYAAFDSLMDGFAVIDEEGTVLFFNKVSESMFGYERGDVLGENVKMLMPDTYAKKHDGYLAKYAATGKKTVVDKQRMVMAKRKDDTMFALTLAVTENKSDDGTRFVASLKQAADSDVATSAGAFSALDALLEAAIVINEEGDMLHFNGAAEKLFGHSRDDCVGQRVEMLMPSPHKESHHFYLQRYLSTGERRVIGKSREVLAELADGSLQMVTLALSEQAAAGDGSKVFTGVLTKVAQSKKGAGGAGAAGGKKRGGDSAVQLARKMISSLQIPGIVVNDVGSVQAFNPAAEQMLGYQLVDVVGRNVNMLMNDKDAAKHDDYLKNYKTTGVAKVIGQERTVQAKTKNGKLIDVKLSVTEAEDDKGKKVWTGLLHQVSQLTAAPAPKKDLPPSAADKK